MQKTYAMKQGILLFAFTIIFFSCQVKAETNTMQVTGSAEFNIIPGEIEIIIHFLIPIRSNEGVEEGPTWDDIDAYVLNAMDEVGIDRKEVSLGNSNYWYYRFYYWSYYYTHHYDYNPQIEKSVTVTVKRFSQADSLIHSIVDQGIEETHISNIRIGQQTHSKMEELRKDLKKAALEAAMNKADYLLESIGKQRGDILEIIEIEVPLNNHNYYWNYNSQSISNASFDLGGGNGNQNSIGMEPITMKSEFQLKVAIL